MGNQMGMKHSKIPVLDEHLNVGWLPLTHDYYDWVCSMHSFLNDLDLKHYCMCDKVIIFYVPNDLRGTVLDKCRELGVLFHIHSKHYPLYKGYLRDERILVGYNDGDVLFEVKCAPSGVGVDEIYYTSEYIM